MVDVSGLTDRRRRSGALPPDTAEVADALRRLGGMQHMMRPAVRTEEEFNERLDALVSELGRLRFRADEETIKERVGNLLDDKSKAREDEESSDRMDRGGRTRKSRAKKGKADVTDKTGAAIPKLGDE